MNTQTVEQNELLETVRQGRLDFFRACSVFSPLPGAAFHMNRDGSVYYASGIEFAVCNGFMENGEIPLTEGEIESALDFFTSRNLPFIGWSSDKELEKKGFKFEGELIGIAMDISNRVMEPASQVEVKMIQSDEEFHAFAHIAVTAYGIDPKVHNQFVKVNQAVMHSGEQVHFLAYLEGRAIGSATLSSSNSAAGIWNLVTEEKYRKKGIGTALVTAALVEAKKRDHDQIMAILMPKGLEWGLFNKLGFKEICKFPFYRHEKSENRLYL